MNSIFIKKLSLLSIVFFTFFNAFSQDEFKLIEAKINQHLKAEMEANKLSQFITLNSSSQQLDGSWKDISYESKVETGWQPLLHLNRIKYFALGFVTEGNKYYGNQLLLENLIKGLEFWYGKNPISNNWFQNEIASPTALGEILILLNKDKMLLPKALQDSLLERMKQGNILKAVGANKLDIATHFIYRACITKDQNLMSLAVGEAFKPISYTSKEGLQYDNSYLQHSAQLQIASYGQVFLIGEYKLASWLQGTGYGLSADKLQILDNYLINTYLQTIRGRYIDFNTEGRGISRNDILDKMEITESGTKKTLLAMAKSVSPENSALFNAAQERISQKQAPSFNISPLHTQFWKGDYTLHIRPGYSFNVRTVSKRTIRTEVGNKENLLGKFLPDGSTNIQRSGAEYYNIMPIWEWDKIPGITSRDYKKEQPFTIEWGERGISRFVGGVSDGVYGTSVYDLNYNEVAAKKAWFYFDKQVVCLGAEINSYALENIVTTINQSWKNGNVKGYAAGKIINFKAKHDSSSPTWIWHDSIGYYFPNPSKLEISKRTQKGSWSLINGKGSKKKIKGQVFKMWFDHGFDPINETYAYVVKPGVSEADMKSQPQTEIKILANNSSMQAVKNEDLKMIQVVFYEAGTLTDPNLSITVDQPCVVLLRAIESEKPIIYLADPTQKLKSIQIAIQPALSKVEHIKVIDLPIGDFAGSTVSYEIK
ncbi:chondroitin AC lyase [Pedobacter sp. CG_S7]|uniref:polysaccharide lyase family 8 super-sandwich domain-containing protein n=1 Tax=Pedobacter sp. CG_S7 TaxID=3143930 RepID=UPI00339513BA